MQPPPADPVLEAASRCLLAASVLTCVYLIVRLRNRGHILPFERRQPVPWGLPAALVAFVVVALTFSAALTASAPDPPPAPVKPAEAAEQIIGFIVFQLAVTFTALAITLVTSQPSWRDFGLPSSGKDWIGAIRIGVIACVAAVAPVFGILALARDLSGGASEPSHHPLVEAVFDASNFGILLLASISAVILAPICEEIVFRVLLQGWLEKWEDERLGWRKDEVIDEARMTNEDGSQLSALGYQPNDSADSRQPIADSSVHSSFDTRDSTFAHFEPPQRGLAGLPYGWAPILISSFMFAVAHIGYGPEPVPLFVLALILGYVYQRTHSVVPGIVTHGLFNLLSVIALWRLISLAP